MNNNILLIFFASTWISNSVFSQTITPEWFYKAGEEFVEIRADIPSSSLLTEPVGGLDQTWDFSTAVEEDRASLTFELPDLATLPERFMDVELQSTFQNSSTFYQYYSRSPTNDTLFLVGSLLPDGQEIAYFPNNIIASSPFEYLDSSSYTVTATWYKNENVTFIVPSQVSNKFIGTGNVITPEGEVEGCICILEKSVDQGGNEYWSYRFYKDRLSNIVATYRKTVNNQGAESIRLFWQTTENLSSIDEQTPLDFGIELYGNLNEDLFLVNGNMKNLDLQLFDIFGNRLLQKNAFVDSDNYPLNFENNLPSGSYILLLTDKELGSFKSFKILKQ